MVREKKAEQIGRMKEMGFGNKQIAWLIYRDRSERGQRRVRAMLSYIKKKALLNDSESGSEQQTEQNSLRDIVSKLRSRKNFSVLRLWSKGYSVRMIASLLYGDDSEQSQNRVYAHISKFRKRRRSGCDFHAQNLRSRVGLGISRTKLAILKPNPNRNQNLSARSLHIAMEVKRSRAN